MNKRASGFFDIYSIFIFMFVVTLVSGIALFTWNSFNDAWQDQDEQIVTETSIEASQSYSNNLNATIDGGIVFWFAILWLGSLVTAFFLDNSPIWFIIFLLASIVSFFVLLPFANIQKALAESALSGGYQYLPMAMFISNHMIFFMIAYIVTVGAALYVKTRMTQ